MEYLELLENCMFKNPLALLALKNKESILKVNSYLPFSVGFEIECSPLADKTISSAVKEEFRGIPYILHADVNPNGEIRFRIPAGINGFICLYYISKKLKVWFGLNEGSGIHYHVGLENYTYNPNKNCQDFILKELDTWQYKGSYNKRSISNFKGNWVRYPTALKTVEYRIGEMTFDYDLLIKRIVHVSSITQYVIEHNTNLRVSIPNYEFDVTYHLSYLKINQKSNTFAKLLILEEQIKELEEQKHRNKIVDVELEKTMVKTRTIRI